MSLDDEDFLRQLRATFKVEAEEHVQALAAGLLELEKTRAPDARRKIIETVFRAAHSLKGAARAVDFIEIESLCQSLEDEFASWRRKDEAPTADVLDRLHRSLDEVSARLRVSAGSSGPDMLARSPPTRLPLSRTDASGPLSGVVEPASEAPYAPTPLASVDRSVTDKNESNPSEETVRVAVAKLQARLLESEEMLVAKFSAGQRATDLRELAGSFDALHQAWAAVEPEARRLRQSAARGPAPGERRSAVAPTRVLDFIDWSLNYLRSVESRATAMARAAELDRQTVGKLVDDLLEDSKKLLLLPLSSITASLPRLVRDLCREQGKEAELVIHGQEVAIDKRILEEMKDPLVHFLRNSVDHGIELPAERARLGKPAKATITLAVSQVNGSKVQFILSDDGAGIDTQKVKQAAVRRGLIPEQEAARLGEPEAQALVFLSDVSTSRIITQLSGRGLGLAIVREKALKLGGEVSVQSSAGAGTRFRIVVPAQRGTFRGVLVEAAGRLLVVPTAQIARVMRVRPDDIKTVEGRETIVFEERAIALVRLADVLELPRINQQNASPGGTPVIVLGSPEQRLAFSVDAVLDEQEVLVKPLRKPLSRVRNVAAATILGSGRVAPVLNVADLIKSARRHPVAPDRAPFAAAVAASESRKILVVEDSITSRMLLKSILESAGYRVKIAVDGMEGFTLLREDVFDLVVSDVEMPRLNGFDLTARIRADPKLAQLPVVLVTALETREDRERGIDVGANAYIVKGSFDQSNLLDAVKRLT